MPFINGRYHMNPALGQALEDARSAAEELLASDDASRSSSDDDFADRAASSDEKGPIHRIEIESAEVVPGHTGRATHGFVARVHRKVSVGAQQVVPPGRRQNRAPEAPVRGARESVEPGGSVVSGNESWLGAADTPQLRPETHVFADHRDLLDFLRSELADDCSRS